MDFSPDKYLRISGAAVANLKYLNTAIITALNTGDFSLSKINNNCIQADSSNSSKIDCNVSLLRYLNFDASLKIDAIESMSFILARPSAHVRNTSSL